MIHCIQMKIGSYRALLFLELLRLPSTGALVTACDEQEQSQKHLFTIEQRCSLLLGRKGLVLDSVRVVLS